MTYNFNINPYYDDYSDDKNFYRILFKPGRAVQARELTQLQTILQRQISRFGNHIFKEGSVVSDANFVLDDSAFYIKCETQYQGVDVDFTTIEGRYIIESTTGRIALVKKFVAATETDPPTVYASVVDGDQLKFNDGATFTVVPTQTSTEELFSFVSVGSSSSGESLLFSVSEGVFYTKETFVYNEPQTVVLGKYSKIASYIVGFNVVETIVDSTSDTTLLDPALGSSNYLAPGADRYKIDLILTTQTYTDEAVAYENFIEIASVRNGYLESDKRRPVYNELGDTLARRTYDESGDYIVRNFIPKLYDNANNDNQLVLEISAGKAYVRGYEIETISPTFLDVRKSRDTEVEENYQLITPQGNYTYVTNIIGSLPRINGNTLVEIHNTTTNLSSDTLIGTTFIRNLEYLSGIGANSVFALFLRDILFTKSSFNTAKSFVIPNGTNYTTPIFKTDVDITAIVEGNSQLYESTFNKSLFVLPQNYIKTNANTAYTYKQKFTRTVSSGSATITARVGDTLSSASQETTKRELYTIVNVTTGQYIPLENASITITASDNSATINFGSSIYDGQTIDIITTVETTNDAKRNKSLVSNFNVQISVANTNPISLLKSDIYELKAVYELESNQTFISLPWSSATTYSSNDVVLYANTAYVSLVNDNLNVQPDTDSNSWVTIVNSKGYYTLDNGQRDNTYEHGSVQRRSQPLQSLNAVVIFDYFTHSGTGHLSSNSYPSSVGLTNIPDYVSKTDNTLFRMRDCIDFRARRVDDTNTVSYDFCQVPRGFTNVVTDVEYYLRRIDKVILTKNGNFKVVEGISSLIDPKPPASQDDSITLFILTFEPYTNRIEDVSVKILPYRRYTMKDIGNLDDRLSRVEYYTSLSILEKEVESKSFTDENGDQLFKNGFLVDSFKGHSVGDVTNLDYRCSIDYTNGILRPLYESYNIKLNPTDSGDLGLTSFDTAIQTSGGSQIFTLPYTANVFVNQPLASSWSSLNPFDLISFNGSIELYPSSDVWYDEQTLPDVIINKDGENDNYSNFLSVSTQWNAWETLWTGENKLEDRVEVVGDRQITKTKYEVTQKQTRTGEEILKAPPSVVLSKSTKMISQSAIPYTRAKDIQFKVTGLAPNTKLYLYIDGKNVSNFLYNRDILGDIKTNFDLDNSVVTDNTGTAYGLIKFPNNDLIKFLTGAKRIILCDQPFDYKMASSYAETEYFSQGTLQTKQTTIVSTRSDYTVRRSLSDNRSVTTVVERVTNDQPWYDPNLPDAIYTLTPSKDTVVEGSVVSFVFAGQFVPSGRTYIANVSGSVTSSNVSGVTPNVPFSITTSGTFSRNFYDIKVPIINDGLVKDNKYITCTVQVPRDNVYPRFGGPLTLTSNVTILEATSPSFTASAPVTVKAGQNVVVSFAASNLQPSANIPVNYTVSGTVLSTDYGSNAASGSFIVNTSSSLVSLTFNTSPTLFSTTGSKSFIVTFNTPTTSVGSTTKIVNPSPIYGVTSFPSSIKEGDSLKFIVNTEYVTEGSTINYVIDGVSSANINGASLSGTLTVANKQAILNIQTTDDLLSKSDKTITFRILESTIANTNTASVLILDNGNPSYTLSTNNSIVSEGNTFVVRLETTKIPAGTSVPYTITGVATTDYTGSGSTGNFTIGANGVAQIPITVISDGLAESPETFKLSLNNVPNNNVEVTFVDSGIGTPVYTLTPTASAIDEGSEVTFILKTLNVSAGNTVPWQLSGIEQDDLNTPVKLNGSFIIAANGNSYQTISVKADSLSEGEQTMQMSAITPSGTITSNVIIRDTSIAPSLTVRPLTPIVKEGEEGSFLIETTGLIPNPLVEFTFGPILQSQTKDVIISDIRNNVTTQRDNGVIASDLQSVYTTPGTYSWKCPDGVTSVSVVCIGGGSGGGGGLGWKNNISVTPGSTYTVVVGNAAAGITETGGNSYFINASTVQGNGAVSFAGGGYVGDGGGFGGDRPNSRWSGGGGAGGYNGRGGKGGDHSIQGEDGQGGAGGGGGYYWPGGGGGTSIWGQSSSGKGGIGFDQATTGGKGGSGGSSGGNIWSDSTQGGGLYGGGYGDSGSGVFKPGHGAVRIVWGSGVSFPYNATTQLNKLESTSNAGSKEGTSVLNAAILSQKFNLGETGKGIVSFKFVEDFTTEGIEEFRFKASTSGRLGAGKSYNLSDEKTMTILDTSLTPPSFVVTGPQGTIYEGTNPKTDVTPTGEMIFYVVGQNLISDTNLNWTFENPNNLYIIAGERTKNDGTVIISGDKDWNNYVDINFKVLTLYNDANASVGVVTTAYNKAVTNKSVTQLFAQQYPGAIWSTPGDQYNSWVRNDTWRRKAEESKAAFGQWYYENYGKNDSTLTLPLASRISGVLPVKKDGTASKIVLFFKEDGVRKTTNLSGTLKLANQSITVNLKGNSFTPDYARFNVESKKLVGTGDFLDSKLTYQNILGEPATNPSSIIYYYDGKQPEQVISDPAFAGKLSTTSFAHRQASYYHNEAFAILAEFRDPAKLNRNPTLNEFIYWVKYLIRLKYATDIPRSPNWFEAVGDNAAPSTPRGYVHSSMLNYGVKLSDGTSVPGTSSLRGSCTRIRFVTPEIVQSKIGTTKKLYRFWYTRFSRVNDAGNRGHAVTYFINKKQIAKDLPNINYEWKYVDVEIDPSKGFSFEVLATQDEGGSEGCNNITHHPLVFGFVFTNTNVTTVPARSTSLLHSVSPEMKDEQPFKFVLSDGSYVLDRPLMDANLALAQIQQEIQKYAESIGEKYNTRASFLACTTDPLAQTFFVSGANYPNGIFLDSVSLYFRTKDEKLPVFAEIRPTENGYPSASKIIPLSTVWKNHFEVNTSQDATAETNFKFKAPIYLPPGEYAIVTGSNSSKYFAFVAGIGEQELRTGNIISEQPYVGSLFKSQNATTWTAEQKQDLCFKLYKCNFDTGNTALLFATNSVPEKIVEYQTFKLTSEELDVSEETDIKYEMLMSANGVVGTEFIPVLANKNTNIKTTKDSRANNDTIVKVALSSTNPDISPVIDTERMSLIAVKNIIGKESDVNISEELPIGGNSLAKYVSRSVTLAEGFDATRLRVIFDINRPIGTSVKVYFKVKASDDDDDFDNKYYQEMPMVEKAINFTTNENQFVIDEYISSDITYDSKGVTYYNFKTFAVKIVMYSENPAFVPQIKNLRVIALT